MPGFAHQVQHARFEALAIAIAAHLKIKLNAKTVGLFYQGHLGGTADNGIAVSRIYHLNMIEINTRS